MGHCVIGLLRSDINHEHWTRDGTIPSARRLFRVPGAYTNCRKLQRVGVAEGLRGDTISYKRYATRVR